MTRKWILSLSTNQDRGQDPEVDLGGRGRIFPPIGVRIIFRASGISDESWAIRRLWGFPMSHRLFMDTTHGLPSY